MVFLIFILALTMIEAQIDANIGKSLSHFPSHDNFFTKPFDSKFPLNFDAEFDNLFSEPHFADIEKSLDTKFKPSKLFQSQKEMKDGIGGTTIIEAPGKLLLKRDGTTLECSGIILPHKPFCKGKLKRFQIKNQRDYCYSDKYSQMDNFLCIAHNDQNGVSFSNINGRYSCSGSDERPTLLISLKTYKKMCLNMPWENIYYYFPDLDNPFHIELPNKDLGCLQKSQNVCVFKIKDKKSLDF